MKVDLFQVFISSPSEMDGEREIIQQSVDELNRLVGRDKGYRLETLDWRTDVSSGPAKRPQERVNQTIGNSYHIYIGVVCAKFGTDTGVAGSGTEEEFDLAISRFLKTEIVPQVMFFFKDPREAKEELDPVELVKISDFKSKVRQNVVTKDFSDREEFRVLVTEALRSAVEVMRSNSGTALASSEIVEHAETLSDEIDDDLGFLDLAEDAAADMDCVSQTIGRMSQTVVELTRSLEAAASALTMAQGQKHSARTALSTLSSQFKRYSEAQNVCLDNLEGYFERSMYNTRKAVIIGLEDSLQSKESMREDLESLFELQRAFDEIPETISPVDDAIRGYPRVTSEFNRAKRLVLTANQRVVDFMTSASRQISAVTTLLD